MLLALFRLFLGLPLLGEGKRGLASLDPECLHYMCLLVLGLGSG